jgi:hypothetical protein
VSDDWERVDTGIPDRSRLATVRSVAIDYEPLVTDTEFDRPLDPETLHLHLDAGIEADTGRFDVTWTDRGYYRYHYTEGPSFNFRYDRHPRPDLPDAHFHEPPDAEHDDAVPSCIEVGTARLVTLAVLQLWRDAFESDDPGRLQQPDPP